MEYLLSDVHACMFTKNNFWLKGSNSKVQRIKIVNKAKMLLHLDGLSEYVTTWIIRSIKLNQYRYFLYMRQLFFKLFGWPVAESI
jgi:hypothetical protein